jgi:hypothetical protein
MVMNAEQRVRALHEELLGNVRRLSEQMTRLLGRLESDGAEARFHELGEVQDLGLQVDRGLALLAAARSARDGLRSLLTLARQEGRGS